MTRLMKTGEWLVTGLVKAGGGQCWYGENGGGASNRSGEVGGRG